jgi:hypothetical protein
VFGSPIWVVTVGDSLRAMLQDRVNSTFPLSYLWAGPSIHIGYSPTDPHIIQTRIILTDGVGYPFC